MGSTLSTPQCTDCFALLPTEVTHRVASFLLGVELLPLAHASPALLTTLNMTTVWAERIAPNMVTEHTPPRQPPSPAWWCPQKAAYLQNRALVFGRSAPASWVDRLGTTNGHHIEDFVAFPAGIMRDLHRFSIEVTFSIAPKKRGSKYCHGGILVGFQSEDRTSTATPSSFLALVSIDAYGGLRPVASDRSAPTSVAAQVTFGVWHCLVLAFDGRYIRGYLDGELRYFKRIPHGFNWDMLRYGQIGTGFGFDPSRTLATYSNQTTAWRPFHGLVAKARVWSSVAGEDDARRLASGRFAETQLPLFSVNDVDAPHVTRVLASRPCEQYVETLRL